MTTIAGSHQALVLVADSRVSDGDQTWSEEKIERIDGGLYGAAGESADAMKFFEWIRKGKRGRKPKVEDDFSALALTAKGLFLFDSHLHPMRMQEPFAIGSGGKAARAAMLCGKTVIEAVEIACQVDAGSSLPVRTYSLEAEA